MKLLLKRGDVLFWRKKRKRGKQTVSFFLPFILKRGVKRCVHAHLPSVRCFTTTFENTNKCGKIVICVVKKSISIFQYKSINF